MQQQMGACRLRCETSQYDHVGVVVDDSAQRLRGDGALRIGALFHKRDNPPADQVAAGVRPVVDDRACDCDPADLR